MVVLQVDAEILEKVQAIPKIELHRHLEGSVRLSTLSDIARQYDMEPNDEESLLPFVQMTDNEPRTAAQFLAKFKTLRQFYRSHDLVARITREVVEDAAKDNIQYLELRFTPKALCNFIQIPVNSAVELVCETANQAAQDFGIQVRYIISMNRHESVEQGEIAVKAALAYMDKGVVGVDLAGDEENFSALPFRNLFHRAKSEGLYVTIHAGEWAGAGSVWDAIGNLKADRVGHGIKVLNDPSMVNILVEREIALEVCPTSNYLSGIVDSLSEHPMIELTRQGVLTTLNTDDPSICNITLSEEIARAIQYMGMTIEDVRNYTLRAARTAFLARAERDALVRKFQGLMSEVVIS
jgi:adenosine deaminase